MKIKLRDREGVAIAALEGRLQQGMGDVLDSSRILPLFETFHDEDDALAAFSD